MAHRWRRTPKRFWKKAGLRPITLHDCRHTFASLLIDSGTNPKAVQEFMGHSKIQTTFDTYGHPFPGSHDEVRERMNAYLESVPGPGSQGCIWQTERDRVGRVG